MIQLRSYWWREFCGLKPVERSEECKQLEYEVWFRIECETQRVDWRFSNCMHYKRRNVYSWRRRASDCREAEDVYEYVHRVLSAQMSWSVSHLTYSLRSMRPSPLVSNELIASLMSSLRTLLSMPMSATHFQSSSTDRKPSALHDTSHVAQITRLRVQLLYIIVILWVGLQVQQD